MPTQPTGLGRFGPGLWSEPGPGQLPFSRSLRGNPTKYSPQAWAGLFIHLLARAQPRGGPTEGRACRAGEGTAGGPGPRHRRLSGTPGPGPRQEGRLVRPGRPDQERKGRGGRGGPEGPRCQPPGPRPPPPPRGASGRAYLRPLAARVRPPRCPARALGAPVLWSPARHVPRSRHGRWHRPAAPPGPRASAGGGLRAPRRRRGPRDRQTHPGGVASRRPVPRPPSSVPAPPSPAGPPGAQAPQLGQGPDPLPPRPRAAPEPHVARCPRSPGGSHLRPPVSALGPPHPPATPGAALPSKPAFPRGRAWPGSPRCL